MGHIGGTMPPVVLENDKKGREPYRSSKLLPPPTLRSAATMDQDPTYRPA